MTSPALVDNEIHCVDFPTVVNMQKPWSERSGKGIAGKDGVFGKEFKAPMRGSDVLVTRIVCMIT